MRYIGKVFAAGGYRLDPDNIKAVKDLLRKKPENLGNVRRLLGMTGYFKKYISSFSKNAEPLYVLLKKIDGQSNASKSNILG